MEEKNVFVTKISPNLTMKYVVVRELATKQAIYDRANAQLKLRLKQFLTEEFIDGVEWRVFDHRFMCIYDEATGGRYDKIMNIPKYVYEIASQQTTESIEVKED